MFGRIDAYQHGGIDLMGGDRYADAVREFDHAPLLQVRQPYVALDQVVLQHLCAVQLLLQMCRPGNGDAHLVVHTLPFEQIAGDIETRTGTNARVHRLAALHAIVRLVTGITHGSDAESQPGAIDGLTKVRLRMRVRLDEAGNRRESGCIHHRVVLTRHGAAARRDGRDPIGIDDDIDVAARLRTLAINQRADAQDDTSLRNGRRVVEVDRHGADGARFSASTVFSWSSDWYRSVRESAAQLGA